MHTDLSIKPDFSQLSGQDLVRYNNAMVREILATGLTGYKEVSVFQNKEAGIKRCEANWSSLVCGRANREALAAELLGSKPKKIASTVTVRVMPEPGRSPIKQVGAILPQEHAAVAGSKAFVLAEMLTAGSTVDAMCAALGWQAHTLRARISTSGIKVQRTRVDGVTSYRVKS
jgi:hypothetical protein